MKDTCIINKEAHSLRERDLKAKLFGKQAMPMPKTYVQEMERQKAKRHIAEMQPSEYLYKPPVETTSVANLQKKEM